MMSSYEGFAKVVTYTGVYTAPEQDFLSEAEAKMSVIKDLLI